MIRSADSIAVMTSHAMSRRAVWVGTHGRERVEVIILRECKAWTLCRVVHTGMVERMHPDEIRPI